MTGYDAYQRPGTVEGTQPSRTLYATAFVYHAPTFTNTPLGFARCRVCGFLFDADGLFSERCPGPMAARPASRPAEPRCALCGDPLVVEPRHRETVALFGSVCNACAGMGEAIGAEPCTQEAAA